jgi:16S rRNA (cytosine967-C5)-methyltransferase
MMDCRDAVLFCFLCTVSRFHSYINSAVTLLNQYKGEEPFAAFLKKYFAANKKYGSKDRKQIAHCCYCYFRAAQALDGLKIEEKILTALFLCSQSADPVLQNLRPEWMENISLSTGDKWAFLKLPGSIIDLFPWTGELSSGIDPVSFAASFLVQPDLFIRIRPGHEQYLRNLFTTKQVPFQVIAPDCLSFSAGTRLDELIATDKEAVIQDYNSQQVGELIAQVKQNRLLQVWDACAASGGKSIMTKDRLGNISLTVSDIRESILHNLKKRFAEAGISGYTTMVADLSTRDPLAPGDLFDLVIADVPCTGSGTWGRTPEQLYYFDLIKLSTYSGLQQKIVTRILPHVKPGGYFLYITCSVFKEENETRVENILSGSGFTIVKQAWLAGYDKKADSMFACLFRKEL